MRIYAMFGKQAEILDERNEQLALTLQLLHDLKAGKVILSQVTVTETGWTVTPLTKDAPNADT